MRIATSRLNFRIVDNLLKKRIIDNLFPENRHPTHNLSNFVWLPEYEVTCEEIRDCTKKLRGDKKAPGPDGFLGGIISASSDILLKVWVKCFTLCLKEGTFPPAWKIARLTLLKKKDISHFDPGNFRPICLLSECGKLLERIIVNRLHDYLENFNGLSTKQFGFRRGKSTINAIEKLRSDITRRSAEGKFIIVISLDISNAFNSLPWHTIISELKKKKMPSYLCRIIESYFTERYIKYIDCDGTMRERKISCGIPQGSALGPVLWNIGYNSVLDVQIEDCEFDIICYADDITLIISNYGIDSVIIDACLVANNVIRVIESLGLRVATHKTEAILFPPGGKGRNYNRNLFIKDTIIRLSNEIKYLGVTLDNQWSFIPHFTSTIDKVNKTTDYLSGIMPNMRGPNLHSRLLYANVIISIFTYGAPIWSQDVQNNKKVLSLFNKAIRRVAQRVCRSYRTVSCVASCLIAGLIPIDILADKLSLMYKEVESFGRNYGRFS